MSTETSNVLDLEPVESSQIHAIGYDVDSATLVVQFKQRGAPGLVYHYANVPPEKFEAFRSAKSLGGYFAENIKGAVDEHPYTKVAPAPEGEGA